ncbi:MAG: hypothetical protein AAFY66_04540 [Pseudomonadota bacterium]
MPVSLGTNATRAASGGLRLLSDAVMAWSAVRMDAIAAAHPELYPTEHLTHIAPAAHRHVDMNGVMRCNLERASDLVPSEDTDRKAAR